MLFALLALYSNFSFTGLAADYYGYAAVAAQHPALPGHVVVVACPEKSLSSFCDTPSVTEVPIPTLARDAGRRMRVMYWVSVVISYGLLRAYRFYLRSRMETLLYIRQSRRAGMHERRVRPVDDRFATRSE